MNNLTIGQYVPGHSWIYKMDPRLKIVLTILWIVMLFLVPVSIYPMLITLAVITILVLSTRVPFIKMLNGMRPVIFLMLFTFVLQLTYEPRSENPVLLNTFNFDFGLFPLLSIIALVLLYIFTSRFMPSKLLYFIIIVVLCFAVQSRELVNAMGANAFLDNFHFGSYKLLVYEEGLELATSIVIRIICMIMLTSLLTFTTRYQEINQGLISLLSPLKLIHVPVGTFAMMLSLSLRFIPTLVSETNKIMKAQASRGVDFSEGSFKQKINQVVSLLVPLFIVSFRKADDLANAMEARGYIMDAPRTSVDVLKFKITDYLYILISIAVLAGVIVARIYL
ncbi:MAG: energy-coupling factor transporter transmembrane protein EcfT [Acholeplasmatales bacterium]|nr:energy-coupling factor transporter transmembrane protein EcfT [Acholeplasmatales bacterium]